MRVFEYLLAAFKVAAAPRCGRNAHKSAAFGRKLFHAIVLTIILTDFLFLAVMHPIPFVTVFDAIVVYRASVSAVTTPHNRVTSATGRQNTGLMRSREIQIVCT